MSLRLQKIILSFLTIYAFFGFVLLPYILKSQLQNLVSQKLHANVEIDSLYINPFLFKLRLSGVTLKDLEEKELVRFKSLFVDFELYSLFRGAIHFDDIVLIEPKISLVYDANKTFNLQNILKTPQQEQEDTNSSSSLAHIIIERLKIKEGVVLYEDYTHASPFYFTLSKIGFSLEDVDSDESSGMNTSLRFFANLEDKGFVDFKSQISSLASLEAKGSINFQASKLYDKWKYFQDMLNFEVADGHISLKSDYTFSLKDINATRLENLSLGIDKLRIKPKKKNKDIINLEHFALSDANISPFAKSAQIENITFDALKVNLKRSAGGAIDWSHYFSIGQDEDRDSNESAPWEISLHEFSLENSTLSFEDSMVNPLLKTEIDSLNFYALDISLFTKEPFPYTLGFKLNKKGVCDSKGKLLFNDPDFVGSFKCKGIDVARYNPYIKKSAKEALAHYNIELKLATLDLQGSYEVKKSHKNLEFQLKDASLDINNLLLQTEVDKKEFLRFSALSASGINLDTQKRAIQAKKIMLNKSVVKVERSRDGSLNVENLIKTKESLAPTQKEQKPYSLLLKHFALNNAELEFKDNSLEQQTKNSLKEIYINLYNVASEQGSFLDYDAKMHSSKGGTLSSKGKIRHTPLKQSGVLELKNISLLPLNPYVQESAYISIEDGRVSLSGKMEYEKNKKAADLRLDGSILLESLFINNTAEQTQLFSLGSARAKSFTFELSPERLFIDEIDVNAFYVDASIDEKSTLNFSKLLKPKKETQSELNATEAKSDFPYRIARLNVHLGSAKFADYSIPLKFFTHIHDLEGSIYSISSVAGDTSYIDIIGEIDKYASVELDGSIDAGDPKVYTDIDLRFKNIDLNTLSGYSASFAGYEIDSGKLYLDLGYEIQNGELLGTNAIHIHKIKLGKRVKGVKTALPLRFAIGLLEDPSGFIDINMPVRGNLDNPNFDYRETVMNTMGSLITSAVTSPFRFLGAVMGLGGAELEYIAYEPGSAQITPPQREKLDRIAELMAMKPKIVLKLSGQYEAQKDKEALQMKKLVDLVVEKSGIKNTNNNKNVLTTEMLEEIYEDIYDDEALEKLQQRLRGAYREQSMYERNYNKELISLCRDMQAFDDGELITLAELRAEKIRAYLLEEKMLGSERVEIEAFKYAKKSKDSFVKLILELEVK